MNETQSQAPEQPAQPPTEPADSAGPFVSLASLGPITSEPQLWLWPSRIPQDALTIVEGDPGAFKSGMMISLAADLTAGERMPGFTGTWPPRGNCLWLAQEESIKTLGARFEAAGGDPSRIFIPPSGPEGLRFPRSTAEVERFIRSKSIRLMVLDPITEFLDGDINRDTDIRRGFTPLCRIAQELGCAIVGIRHLRKSGGGVMYRGVGGIAWSALARSVLLVGRTTGDRRVVAHVKSSNGPLAATLAFGVSGGEERPPRITWLGEDEITAEGLGSTSPRERPQLDEAKRMMVGMLSGGGILARQVQRAIRGAGISNSTIARAKSELGVQSIRDGFGPDAVYFWVLPNSVLRTPAAQELLAADEAIQNSAVARQPRLETRTVRLRDWLSPPDGLANPNRASTEQRLPAPRTDAPDTPDAVSSDKPDDEEPDDEEPDGPVKPSDNSDPYEMILPRPPRMFSLDEA